MLNLCRTAVSLFATAISMQATAASMQAASDDIIHVQVDDIRKRLATQTDAKAIINSLKAEIDSAKAVIFDISPDAFTGTLKPKDASAQPSEAPDGRISANPMVGFLLGYAYIAGTPIQMYSTDTRLMEERVSAVFGGSEPLLSKMNGEEFVRYYVPDGPRHGETKFAVEDFKQRDNLMVPGMAQELGIKIHNSYEEATEAAGKMETSRRNSPQLGQNRYERFKFYMAGPDVFLSNVDELTENQKAEASRVSNGQLEAVSPVDSEKGGSTPADESKTPADESKTSAMTNEERVLAIFKGNVDKIHSVRAIAANLMPFRKAWIDLGTAVELGMGFGIKHHLDMDYQLVGYRDTKFDDYSDSAEARFFEAILDSSKHRTFVQAAMRLNKANYEPGEPDSSAVPTE